MYQRQYIQSLLKRYGLTQAKTVKTTADNYVKLVKNRVNKPVNQVNYESMLGSPLIHTSIATRPDIRNTRSGRYTQV